MFWTQMSLGHFRKTHPVKILALVAALSLGAWQLMSPGAQVSASDDPQTVAFGSRTVQLRVSPTAGESEWADRVTAIIVEGGPALEEMIGVPYPGPELMNLSERTDAQLDGYAGTAGCSHVVCNIRLASDFDDTTLLHELTHAWTQSFRNRWLAEGMAEYISNRASARIDGRPLPVVEPANDYAPFPLLDWMITVDLTTAEEQDIYEVYEGYYWSERFFEQLEATVGADAVKRTMAAVVPVQAGTVGVRGFMDALDDTGVQADDLFIRYVFPPERESEIRDRRAARDKLSALSSRTSAEAPELSQEVFGPVRQQIAEWQFPQALSILAKLEEGLNAYVVLREQLGALRTAAEQAGLPHPYPFENAKTNWGFAPFLESINDAGPAIEAYTAAKQTVSEPRSVWQRIGLIGKSPESHLDKAGAEFAAGQFTRSVEQSRAAESTLDGASGRALVNSAIATAALLLAALSVAVLIRWANSGARAAGSAGAQTDSSG
jgi:hypothetical protein